MSDDFSDIAKMNVHELLDYVIGNPNYLADSYYRPIGRAIVDRSIELQPRPGCELNAVQLGIDALELASSAWGQPEFPSVAVNSAIAALREALLFSANSAPLPSERISELAKRAGYPVTLEGYVRFVRLVEGELQRKAAPDGQNPA